MSRALRSSPWTATTFSTSPPAAATRAISSPITFNGGLDSDTLNLGNASGNLNAITSTITFDGTAGLNDRVILNDQVPSNPYHYDISKTSVQHRDGLFGGLAYANLDRIVLNAGPGDNTVSVIVGIIVPSNFTATTASIRSP